MEGDLTENAEFRKENFKAEVNRDAHEDGGVELRITHNGYQWTTMRFNDEELDEIVNQLVAFKLEILLKKTNERISGQDCGGTLCEPSDK